MLPTSRVLGVAATACVVSFLLDPAAALGRMSPWHMKLQCLDLVAAFLIGVSSAVCTRQPPTAFVWAQFRLPAWSSVHVNVNVNNLLAIYVVAPPTDRVRFCPGALACT